MVEQLTLNQRVAGSSPARFTINNLPQVKLVRTGMADLRALRFEMSPQESS